MAGSNNTLRMEPCGWPSNLEGIQPGPFCYEDGAGYWRMGFKTEYRHEVVGGLPVCTAYNEAGEAWCAPAETKLWPCKVIEVQDDG